MHRFKQHPPDLKGDEGWAATFGNSMGAVPEAPRSRDHPAACSRGTNMDLREDATRHTAPAHRVSLGKKKSIWKGEMIKLRTRGEFL